MWHQEKGNSARAKVLPSKGVFTPKCVLWQFNIAYLGEELIHLASVAATLSRDTTSSGLYKFVNIFYQREIILKAVLTI